MTLDPSCATCRFMRAEVHDDGEPALTCHRYPAAVFVIADEPVRSWPDTKADDWCGEYAPVEDG